MQVIGVNQNIKYTIIYYVYGLVSFVIITQYVHAGRK